MQIPGGTPDVDFHVTGPKLLTDPHTGLQKVWALILIGCARMEDFYNIPRRGPKVVRVI